MATREQVSPQVRTTCAPYVALNVDDGDSAGYWWVPAKMSKPFASAQMSDTTEFLNVPDMVDENGVADALDKLWPEVAKLPALVVGVAIGGLSQPDRLTESLRALSGPRWSDPRTTAVGREGLVTSAYRLRRDKEVEPTGPRVLLFLHDTPTGLSGRSLLPDGDRNPRFMPSVREIVDDFASELREALLAHDRVPRGEGAKSPPEGFAATSKRYDEVVKKIGELDPRRAEADRKQHALERRLSEFKQDGFRAWEPIRREVEQRAEQRAEAAEQLKAELDVVAVAFNRVNAANGLRWSIVAAAAGVLSLVIAIMALVVSVG